jgi:hypothetical protein
MEAMRVLVYRILSSSLMSNRKIDYLNGMGGASKKEGGRVKGSTICSRKNVRLFTVVHGCQLAIFN